MPVYKQAKPFDFLAQYQALVQRVRELEYLVGQLGNDTTDASTGSPAASAISAADVAPSDPTEGDLWTDTSTDSLSRRATGLQFWSFEDGLDGWTATNALPVQSTDWAQDSSASLLLVTQPTTGLPSNTTNTAGTLPYISASSPQQAVALNDVLNVSAWVRGGDSQLNQVIIQLDYYDTNGVFLTSTSSAPIVVGADPVEVLIEDTVAAIQSNAPSSGTVPSNVAVTILDNESLPVGTRMYIDSVQYDHWQSNPIGQVALATGTWTDIPNLANGWSVGGFLRYRLTAENEIELVAQDLQCSGATVADHTTVLNAGVITNAAQPNQNHHFPVYVDVQRLVTGSSSNSEGAGFELFSTGELQCLGIAAAATRVDFVVRLPLDVTPGT